MIALLSCAKKSTQWTENHVLQLTSEFPVVGNPVDLDAAGSKIYVAEDQGGLSIMNLDNSSKVWLTSVVSVDGDTVALKKIRKISYISSLNLLFLNETDGSDLIRIISTSNPDSLSLIESVTGGTSDLRDMKFRAITEVGSPYVYEGIFVTGPQVKYGYSRELIPGLPPVFTPETIEPLATPNGAEITASHVFVAADQRGLLIYNRSTGAQIGEVDLPGEAQKVKIVGSYAYLACRQDGLQIVNVGNPAAPVKVGSFDTSRYATNVDIWNNYAIVSSGGGGVYLFDVTNPANPVLKDNITNCGYVNNVKFLNGKALVASRDQGILVYNIVP